MQMHNSIFSKFLPNFHEKSYKNLKKCSKKFLIYIKIINKLFILHWFYKKLEHFSVVPGLRHPSPMRIPRYKPSLGEPHFPQKIIPPRANDPYETDFEMDYTERLSEFCPFVLFIGRYVFDLFIWFGIPIWTVCQRSYITWRNHQRYPRWKIYEATCLQKEVRR